MTAVASEKPKRAPASRAPKDRAPPAAKPRRIAAPGASAVRLDVLDFVDVYQATPMERIAWIRRGVEAANVRILAERMRTHKDQLMRNLGLPRATVDRKAKERKTLSPEQTERVVGLSKLVGQVQTIVAQSGEPKGFDAAHWVGEWLERANPALGGRRPADLMDTAEGQEVVGSLLARLQSGAYA